MPSARVVGKAASKADRTELGRKTLGNHRWGALGVCPRARDGTRAGLGAWMFAVKRAVAPWAAPPLPVVATLRWRLLRCGSSEGREAQRLDVATALSAGALLGCLRMCHMSTDFRKAPR